MRKKIRWAAAVAACIMAAAIMGNQINTYATDKSDVEDAQNNVEEQREKVEQLQKELAELGANITDTQSYISQLDATLGTYSNQLRDCENKIAAKQGEIDIKQGEVDAKNQEIADKEAEIEQGESDLDAAQKQQDDQYEAMKLRIQYMYECGEETFLDMIFSAEDLADMLGKTEYISNITAYDRQQLANMIETKNQIALMLDKLQIDRDELNQQRQELQTQLAELEDQQAELKSYQAELEEQKTYIDTILAQKESALSSLEGQQNSTQTQLDLAKIKLQETEDFLAQIKKQWEEEQKKAMESGVSAEEATQIMLDSIGLNGGFTWPLPGYNYITSHFGPRKDGSIHSGTDISGAGVYGKPILAAYDGTVIMSQYYSGYGNTVQINHGAGVVTLYAHCSSLAVKVGDVVKAGQVIAYVGATGDATGAHLHITLYIQGKMVNPLDYFTIPKY